MSNFVFQSLLQCTSLSRSPSCKVFNSSFVNRLILFPHKRYSTFEKFNVHLVSDVEEEIKSLTTKLRDHPGRRKIPCVCLPDKLVTAVSKVIEGSHPSIYVEAENFNNQLYSRRLPIEEEEYILRSEKLLDKLSKNNLDDLSEEEREIIGKKVQKKLRCEVRRWKPVVYDEHVSKLYLITRLAANYAASCWVFSELQKSIPSFNPKTFFDFGSGLGSAVWAAHNTWKEIEEYFCVDTSPDMNNLAELLLKGGKETEESTFLKTVFFRQFLPASHTIKYDLVVSAFSLMDLPSLKERLRVIDILWKKTNDTLVIIETGGVAGYSMVLDARDYILQIENSSNEANETHENRAHVVGPCPHDLPCPRTAARSKYPCNFVVTYHPLFSKKSSGASHERFSYVVIRRQPRNSDVESWPRLVQPVVKRNRHVHCHLCCNTGKIRHVILSKTKTSRETYRCARISSWGDLLPVSMSQLTTDAEEVLEKESDDEKFVNST